jgi:tetratricopeptide (TPR) repeat protein
MALCYGYDAATLEQHHAFHVAGLESARRAGSVVDQVISLGSLGWCAIDLGQFADAERYLREATALSSELHFSYSSALVTLGLAYVHFCQGKLEAASKLAEQGLELSRGFNAPERESLALLILSLVAAVQGDAAAALQLGEQSFQIGTGRHFRAYGDWILALVHCGLHNYEVAWRYLRESHHTMQIPTSIPRVLAVAAVLLGQQGAHERAAELLGLVFHSRYSAHGWMERWRALLEMRARLESELGATAYQKLFAHGASLDPKDMADELLHVS